MNTPFFPHEIFLEHVHALYFAGLDQKTPKMISRALKQSGYALRFVPEEKRTLALCLQAYEQTPAALRYFPAKHITEDLCRDAVLNHGTFIDAIPQELRSLEICYLAFNSCKASQRKDDIKVVLAAMPRDLLVRVLESGFSLNTDVQSDYQRYLDDVTKSGLALSSVPQVLRTAELCLEAVRRDASALADVPEEVRALETFTAGLDALDKDADPTQEAGLAPSA